MNKKAISLIEIIIVVVIIGLLSAVGLSYKNGFDDNSFNTKISSDLSTLNNSFLAYKQENSKLPEANSNNNFFKNDSSYAHDKNDDAFGLHGFVTEDLIPKKYLNYFPIDPKTNQFYAYGKTLDDKKLQFEFAGIVYEGNTAQTKLVGDYDGEEMVGLIREYNGPQFLYNKSDNNFPFNPETRLMTAKIGSYSGTISINGDSSNILNKIIFKGDEIKVNGEGFANIYFSDGSRSTIEKDTILTIDNMSYPKDSQDNLITKIKLVLNSGTIWTKATTLNKNGSEFEVSTDDATAAVRGTIFKVEKNGSNPTEVIVDKGEVKVSNENASTELSENKKTKATQSYVEPASGSLTSELLNGPGNNKEITLPSNFIPKITKVKTNIITISQANENTYIKINGDKEKNCNPNKECEITSNTTEIQLCTKIGPGKDNCSKKIKIDTSSNYEEEENQEELAIKKIEETDKDRCLAPNIEIDSECYDLVDEHSSENLTNSIIHLKDNSNTEGTDQPLFGDDFDLNDFAIEITTDITLINKNKFLFFINKYFSLKLNNYGKLSLKYSNDDKYYEKSLNSIRKKNIQILTKVSNNIAKVYINNKIIIISETEKYEIPDTINLYIGKNGIINNKYNWESDITNVKIYKKRKN